MGCPHHKYIKEGNKYLVRPLIRKVYERRRGSRAAAQGAMGASAVAQEG